MASHLTSNDKYSVADRPSSVNSDKNETGRFGSESISVSGFPVEAPKTIIKIEKEDDAHSAGANEGTFGNVSFGDANDDICQQDYLMLF